MRLALASFLVLFLATPSSARPRIDPDAVHAVPAKGASIGPASAKVTLVVGVEYAEPFTKRLFPTLRALVKEYKGDVRVVFRHFVVHPVRGRQAALATCAARKQGRYLKMVDRLLSSNRFIDGDYTDTRLAEYAAGIGLDARRFDRDVHGACAAEVDRDQSELKRFGVTGVPATFVNGRLLSGAQPIDRFRVVIDEEIRLAKSRLRGKRSNGYYRRYVLGRGAKSARYLAEAKGLAAPRRRPARPRPARPDPGTVYAVPTGNGPLLGPANAMVTLVVASEFSEPFTKRLRPVLDSLRTRYGKKLRIIFRHYVVHPTIGRPAALAICAAARQGRFLEMEREIWEQAWPRRNYNADHLESLAQSIGLKSRRFQRDRDGVCAREVDADQRDLKRFGVRGVPGTFVNGRFLSGAQPEARFAALIDEELAKAKQRIGKGGTTVRNYYQRWVMRRGAKSVQR